MTSAPFATELKKQSATFSHKVLFANDLSWIFHTTEPDMLLVDSLQWITAAPNDELKLEWSRVFPTHVYDNEAQRKNTMKMIDNVNQHDPVAGLLGIMPPGIHDLLLTYECLSQKLEDNTFVATDDWLKSKRKQVDAKVNTIRKLCITLTIKIWKRWRTLRLGRIERARQRAKTDEPPNRSRPSVPSTIPRIRIRVAETFEQKQWRRRNKRPVQKVKRCIKRR